MAIAFLNLLGSAQLARLTTWLWHAQNLPISLALSTTLVASAPLHPAVPHTSLWRRLRWAWHVLIAWHNAVKVAIALFTAVLGLLLNITDLLLLTTSAGRRADANIAVECRWSCVPFANAAIDLRIGQVASVRLRASVAWRHFFEITVAPLAVARTVSQDVPDTTLYTVFCARAIAPIRPLGELAINVFGAALSVARLHIFVQTDRRNAACRSFRNDLAVSPGKAATAFRRAKAECIPVAPLAVNAVCLSAGLSRARGDLSSVLRFAEPAVALW